VAASSYVRLLEDTTEVVERARATLMREGIDSLAVDLPFASADHNSASGVFTPAFRYAELLVRLHDQDRALAVFAEHGLPPAPAVERAQDYGLQPEADPGFCAVCAAELPAGTGGACPACGIAPQRRS
jgi:hypothetical protein